MRKTATVVATTLAITMGGVVLEAQQADAATSLESRALAVAKSKQGDPYRYGATGPSAFDCSGLTLYSYKRAGKTLPRTAQSQYNATRHIAWQSRRPGDLVAIGRSSRSITHIGMYAGYWGGKSWMINAPHTGARVRIEPIVYQLTGGNRAYYAHP